LASFRTRKRPWRLHLDPHCQPPRGGDVHANNLRWLAVALVEYKVMLIRGRPPLRSNPFLCTSGG